MSDITSIDARLGRIMYKNTSGDTMLFYPETIAENVYTSEKSSVTIRDEFDVISGELYDHCNNTSNPHEVTAEQVGALSSTPISMASTDGVAYTCTVPGIDSLTAGASFIGIPAIVSTSTSVTLNVNNLGAKQLRRGVSTSSSTTTAGYNESWLAAGKPLRIMYDGLFWIVDNARPYAADLMGTVPIANGGTGATDGATGLANLFAAGSTVLSSNQYGETLPTAGSAGRVFFKKSDGSDMEAINAHISNENNPHNVTAAQVGALSSTTVDMLSDDGVTYTCTVPWITELTRGAFFIGIPKKTSTSQYLKLNVNGFGEISLWAGNSGTTISSSSPNNDKWLTVTVPVLIMYDGTNWKLVGVTLTRAEDIVGLIPFSKGGTGATSGSAGLANLFAAGYTKLSSYQYGDTLPTAGTAGRVFFKKSDDTSTAITTSNIGSQTVNKAKYATDTIAVGTAGLRNQYFVSAEATPTVNGQIAWVYG